ncbi:MAG: hypothetical protein ACRDZX_14635 [Acidimicrobiales bacterium]
MNKKKMAKHFKLAISDDSFSFSRKEAQISDEAALDCFADEAPPERVEPVAPARRSDEALAKVHSQGRADGEVVHSFQSLLGELDTLTRNTVIFTGGARITKLAQPTPLQRRAFELIGVPIPLELKPM